MLLRGGGANGDPVNKYVTNYTNATMHPSPEGPPTVITEFVAFLKQYGVIGLAIAVIIGGKYNDLLKSVVDGLLMPFVGMLTPSGDWRQASWTINNAKFMYGPVIGSVIDFIIVAAVVFFVAKTVLKEKEVAKR